MNKRLLLFLMILMILTLGACSPEIGSEKWCDNLKQKPRGEWTGNQLTDYTINPVAKYVAFSQRVCIRSKASERRFSHSKASSDNAACEYTRVGLSYYIP